MVPELSKFQIVIRTFIFPVVMTLLTLLNIISPLFLIISMVSFVIIFVIIPLIIKSSVVIQKAIIFLNHVQYPFSTGNLIHPEKSGLVGVRNIFINYKSSVAKHGIKLGVWHLVPEIYANSVNIEDPSRDQLFEDILTKHNIPIVIYAHGIGFNRSNGHRLELYKLLQNLQYNVITFDYRGFGDSTSTELSEIGMVEDLVMVYRWILEKLNNNGLDENVSPIYIWGHSLGSVISLHTFSLIASEITVKYSQPQRLRQPNGIILEGSYTNIVEAIYDFVKIWSWLPWFKCMILDPLAKNEITFTADKYISAVSSPLLMLHAEDDPLVSYKLGHKLCELAVKNRSSEYGTIQFKSYDPSLGYGHQYICRDEFLPELMRKFVSDHSMFVPPVLKSGNWNTPKNSEERDLVLHNSFC